MVISKNKKVFYEYTILDEYIAGIMLVGSEMKPLMNNRVSLTEAYCFIRDGEIFIKGMHIAEYQLVGKYDTHEPTRDRKLLLNKKEIRKIEKSIAQKGMTLVPLNIHTNKTGLVKVKIGLGRGKKNHDKKNTIRDRDIKRDTDRELKNH